MIQAIIVGLALGAIYAVTSAGVIITYKSAGILNFAFAAMAFFIARFYYFLNTQHGFGIVISAVLSILVAAPLLGVVLYAALFRILRQSSSIIKVVATIGLAVCLPEIANLFFGNEQIGVAPGLAPVPVRVFIIAGVPVTLDVIITYVAVVTVMITGVVVLRFTDIGLRVRAMVDSEAMTALSGTDPSRMAVGVWAVSSFLAGLVGVLAAPMVGLISVNFTLLLATAFAAAVAAKLSNLGVASVVGLLIGVGISLVQLYLPPTGPLTSAIAPSIPFVFMVVVLLYYMIRGDKLSEAIGIGGALDRAIKSATGTRAAAVAVRNAAEHRSVASRMGKPLIAVVAIVVLPLILQGSWIGLVGTGLAFGLCFLSFTLVTGEGGMIWLCQITFAGLGAIGTAQLSSVYGWNVFAAIIASSIVTMVLGIVIGLLTIRMGGLFVALVTLSFGLLIENLVFKRDEFYNMGVGVFVPIPDFLMEPIAFTYFMIAVFAVVGLLIVNLRRSTAGMALNAVRWSEPGSRSIGLSVVRMKVLVGALGAMVAGLGGGFLALANGAAIPDSYSVVAGLTWLAVLVTVGQRSVVAAAAAGLFFTFVPALFSSYVPASLGTLPTILFGFGAIMVAKNPDGVLAAQTQQIVSLFGRLRRSAPSIGHESIVVAPQSAVIAHTAAPSTAPTAAPTTPRVGDPVGGIKATGITVKFGGLTALSDVDIDVPPGAIAGLVGPNGAGKSTLFQVLSGFQRPKTGEVSLSGHDVTDASPQARAKRGLARTFQHPELFSGLTVRQHLMLAHRVRNEPSRLWTDLLDGRALYRADSPDEASDIDTLMQSLGITDIADHPVIGLPLGSARLVEVGRSLATSPTVLLLDEPCSGLDSVETSRMMTTLRQIASARGISILLVEHDVDLVLGMSDLVYVLDFGVLIASGTPSEIRSSPIVRAAYLGDEELPVALEPHGDSASV